MAISKDRHTGTRLVFWMPKELRAQLDAHKAATGDAVSHTIREAVKAWLKT